MHRHTDLFCAQAVRGCCACHLICLLHLTCFAYRPCCLCRCAGLLLSAAARNKHFQLTVGSVGPLIFEDVHLHVAQARPYCWPYFPESLYFAKSPSSRCSCAYATMDVDAQGPIAHVWISEVSLGHSRSAAKVARAAMSWQFRVPFTVRNLTVELRDGSVPSPKKPKPVSNSKQSSKLLLNSGLKLLLGVLPNIPVRIKQLIVKHQVRTH